VAKIVNFRTGRVWHELHQAREYFTSPILDLLPIGISVIAKSGLYVYVNQTHAEAFGYTPDELALKKNLFEVSAKEDHHTTRASLEKTMDTGEACWIKKSWRHRNGYRVPGWVQCKKIEVANITLMLGIVTYGDRFRPSGLDGIEKFNSRLV
jgi:PAS domain S-box-containing protein